MFQAICNFQSLTVLVVPGLPGASPYMIPGQAQLYPQGPPPTYDQALTHPAMVGQPVSY